MQELQKVLERGIKLLSEVEDVNVKSVAFGLLVQLNRIIDKKLERVVNFMNDRDELIKIVKNLDDQDRLILVLHYRDGLSYESIAGILGTTKWHVKNRLHSILRQISKVIISNQIKGLIN